jgi:eukaryotic-like serine/threonine-protein kinase
MGCEDPEGIVQARLGRVLRNKWHLHKVLAVGGMAAVYLALHRNGKRVAIKVLHPELCRDPSQLRRFLREGYAANAIGDPRVVAVDDDDVDEDGSAFLVMELLEGESLDRMAKRLGGRIPVEALLPQVDQLLAVLEKAHARGVVHRDLKPENLFVTSKGAFKVLDFGIARLREHASEAASDTSQMTVMGTPAYMPPEQAKGRWDSVDERSDLWAVGATMFRLLSGRHVHEAETRNEQLGLAMTGSARSIALLMPELDSVVVDLVDRALAYDPADRWRSATQMRRALQVALPPHARAVEVECDVRESETPTIEPTSAPIVRPALSTVPMKPPRDQTSRSAVAAIGLKRAPLLMGLGAVIAIGAAVSGGLRAAADAAASPSATATRLPAASATSVVQSRSVLQTPPRPPVLASSYIPEAPASSVRGGGLERVRSARPAKTDAKLRSSANAAPSAAVPVEALLDPLDRRR